MDRIRQDLQNRLKLQSDNQQIQTGMTLIQMAEAMEQNQMQERKCGRGRLKTKIDFTPEDPVKPVIQSGEIKTEQKSFEQKYKLGDKLGEGAHAIVRKAFKRSKNSNEPPKLYAVKIFRSGDPEIVNTIKKTYNISRFLHHPSVARTFELYLNEKTEIANLVMEYCPYPSLEEIIRRKQSLSEQWVRSVANDLLKAIAYVHAKGVSHRDIKPDNILVNEDDPEHPTVKIVDFGVSKRFLLIAPGMVGTVVHDMWTRTGNMYYCAPEIFSSAGYNASIDLWAIGVVVYQSLTGRLPFLEDYEQETIDAIRSDSGAQYKLEQFQGLSKVCQDFIKRLLRVNPAQRITVEGALEHPFLTMNMLKMSETPQSRTRDDGMLLTPTKKQQQESLTKSSQMSTFSHASRHSGMLQTDQIKEDEDEQSPAIHHIKQNQLKDKLKQFREETQLTTIHLVKKPEDGQFGAINLEGSYQTFMKGGFGTGSIMQSQSYSNSMSSNHKVPSLTGLPALCGSSEIQEDPNEDMDSNTRFDGFEDFIMGTIETSVVIPENKEGGGFMLDLATELGCPLTSEEVVAD